jgi:hypothetical protein
MMPSAPAAVKSAMTSRSFSFDSGLHDAMHQFIEDDVVHHLALFRGWNHHVETELIA